VPIDQIWYTAWMPQVWWVFQDALNWIWIKLDRLAQDIEGVPFLGEYLVIPVRGLTGLVRDIYAGASEVAWAWSITWGFIHGMVAEDVFLDLLHRWGYDWVGLIPSLNSWIWEHMEKLLETWMSLYVNLKQLLYASLIGFAPWFPLFVESPTNWLLSLLLQDFGPLYWFSIDPLGYITEEIYRHVPFTQYIFDDPIGWLKDRLSDIFGVDRDFWDDPLESIKASLQFKLLDMIEEAKDDLYQVGERLFRYFLEGVW